MNQRPPFDDRDPPPPPGGFNPRYEGDRRARFDEPRGDPFEPERDPFRDDLRRDRPVGRRPMSRSTKWLIALGALLLLGAVAFGLSVGRGGAGSDALDGTGENGAASASAGAEADDPARRCAAPATADLLKRELFRQAAATRGSDEATFANLAGYAALRIGSPALQGRDDGLERVSCSGRLALDLPPGLTVAGGRRTLTATASYDIQPAADGTGDVMTLRGAEGITVPLATLSRAGTPAPARDADTPAPAPPPVPLPAPTPLPGPVQGAPGSEVEPPPPPPVATPAARPSFDCGRARTRGERAVCASPELAALDREMAGFYVSALREADAGQRALLQRTRDRFLGFRDRCTTDRCIADSYRGRISEIRDILDGNWRGN